MNPSNMNPSNMNPSYINSPCIRERILAAGLPSPCYILDEKKLIENGKVLKGLQERTGCKILLAQKAFSNYDLYPAIAPYLAGTEASGLYEARLGAEEMPGKECHVFCAAYREQDFEELLQYAGHIVFNSPSQLKKFGPLAKAAGKQIGLRINPECSTQEGHEIYDPCAPKSRLGTTISQWQEQMTPELTDLLDGIHFHTLCEQDSDALEITLQTVEEKFGFLLTRMKWLNMGGGHHITRSDYDIPRLERCIRHMQETYDLEIYLEPGEAVALNAGYLYTRVLDLLENNGTKITITDMSAACHAPDIIEMPYLPPLYGAQGISAAQNALNPSESSVRQNPDHPSYTYRLGGPTCLAGDIVGDYCFSSPLNVGDGLVFEDMAIYSICKNNTFNGMPLPDIFVAGADGSFELLAHFTYEDFKYRLGRK